MWIRLFAEFFPFGTMALLGKAWDTSWSRGCAGLESDASGEVGRCGVAAGWVHGFVDGVQSAVGSGTSLERVAEDGAAGCSEGETSPSYIF